MSPFQTQTFPLKLWNTLKGAIVDFEPLDHTDARRENRPARVRMYVCGPTVYDEAHLGHARCYVTWDVLYRFLMFNGYDVVYVRNVTDVDDKILNRARERGESPSELAERNYRSFQADMAALNVLAPTHEPRATAYIREMQDGISTLIARQAAYVTPDGSVYFRVSAKADYGKLKFATDDPMQLRKHLDDLKAGARVESEPGKESPLDFALWKAVPPDDPDGWESPWKNEATGQGWGRPGWHMECSAMNHALFGEQIDIHAGGADLIFPHHENEIAQSEAWTGKTPFSAYWLHNGFVNVSGAKMSKSLGNFSTIKAVLKRYSANAIRYFLLTNGYRMPVDFNDDALQSAQKWADAREKLLSQAIRSLELTEADMEPLRFHSAETFQALRQQAPSPALDEFANLLRWMSEDLNTSQALSSLNKVMNRLKTNGSLPASEKSTLLEALRCAISMWRLLGFDWINVFAEPEDHLTNMALPNDGIRIAYQEITRQAAAPDTAATTLLSEILTLRKQAKLEKDWARADAIRRHLTELGFQIIDDKSGSARLEKDGQEIGVTV